ncbi:MAG: lipid IV(A) 3-deoxy-D-manno-octulosonic acid transferase [Burkholderiaceae bacterium]|nr:lipid IV(A) 3-deoxy-D-manno-octulosonic acid transferase [Burkholderiaceae bacterium]
MRALYSLAWVLALPIALVRLWWRGRREPGYRQHIAERLGFYAPPKPSRPLVWVHAVSVGETRAAEPLVDALLATYPDHAILLTHMTPTGRATGAALFAHHGNRVTQCYLPYDTVGMTGRFLRHFAPRLGILMETEIWPNLIAQCVRHHVPLALVNARLSERSLKRGQRFATLMKEAASGIVCVAAQTEADAARLRQFGSAHVEVTGSVKFDVTPPIESAALGATLRSCFGSRPVLLCASTRDGEEALLLDALPLLDVPDALLVVVPRHPRRFDEVASLIAARGLNLQRRSTLEAGSALPTSVQVLLGDSMGEMFAYYAACDCAFIGGSLLPFGGQNLIEACAVGKPVIVGPHTFNFGAITEDAVATGAALRVPNAAEALRQASHLLHDVDRRTQMGEIARMFAQRQHGATRRTMALLAPLLK